MFKISFDNNQYEVRDLESVLDCLLRNGHDIPYSCQSGVCKSCIMQSLDALPSHESQNGLKPTLQVQKYFLACKLIPTCHMSIKSPAMSDISIAATISRMTTLTQNILSLHITPSKDIDWRPGQYLSLSNDNNITRSYSIANDPSVDGYIELHIKLVENGTLSNWLRTDNIVGQSVNIRGPHGDCFYVQGAVHQPMLLAGVGTGLSPLYGIANQALAEDHKGEIHLLHGALTQDDLYYQAQLIAMTKKHSNFHYVPCVLNGSQSDEFTTGDIQDIAPSYISDPSNTAVYVCGSQDFVTALKKKVFMAGVPSKNIFSDSFITKKYI